MPDDPAGQPLIALRGVTKVYGEGATAFSALKGIDLDIARGDIGRASCRERVSTIV